MAISPAAGQLNPLATSVEDEKSKGNIRMFTRIEGFCEKGTSKITSWNKFTIVFINKFVKLAVETLQKCCHFSQMKIISVDVWLQGREICTLSKGILLYN